MTDLNAGFGGGSPDLPGAGVEQYVGVAGGIHGLDDFTVQGARVGRQGAAGESGGRRCVVRGRRGRLCAAFGECNQQRYIDQIGFLHGALLGVSKARTSGLLDRFFVQPERNGKAIPSWAAGYSVQGSTGTWIMVLSVPILAAIWLFGSGLLGLISIARRKKVA